MAEPAISEEVVEAFSDRIWRLENLYWITDEYGQVIQFKLREAQRKLLDELHFLNLILKARQEGFSTLIVLLALDCCIFNDHFAAGLVADTMKNAENLLSRAKFAYDHMPEEIQTLVPVLNSNNSELTFANGSSIEAGVSLRSSTKNFLHVSEYGKICAKTPDKAKEVKSGSLNTLAPQQLGFIESTAEGKGGDFYDKSKQARALIDAHREPTDLEWKFHFFAWFLEPRYSSTTPYPLTADDVRYFENLLVEHGIQITDQQKWWYAAKSREQGDAMFKEFPSTPDEAFQGAVEGAIFGMQVRALRQRGRIGRAPFVPGIPVDTFWDFGINDMQTIWFRQLIAGEHRFVGYYENNNVGFAHYAQHLERWATQRGAVYGVHRAPHDVDAKRPGEEVTTIKKIAAGVGIKFVTVNRNPSKVAQIEGARQVLPACMFDEQECAKGIEHLESYGWVWDPNNSIWLNNPKHDEHSHGADGFMTFTDSYKTPKPTSPPPPPPPPPASFWSR